MRATPRRSSRSPRFLTSKVVVARTVFRQPVSILWITSVRDLNQPVENRLVPLAPATGDGSGDTYYPDHHTGLGNDWKETEKEPLENEKRSGEWKTRRERYETGSKRTQDPANGDRQRPGASGGAPASRWLRPKPGITPRVDQLPDRSRPQPGTQS